MFGRISVAQKNLFHEKGRLLISVAGVTFAVFLILILVGLYRGWSETLSKYIYTVGADVWVMQKGSIDMSHSISLLPNATQEQLESVTGVETVYSLVGNRIMVEINGDEVTTRVIGFDTANNIGGPFDLIEGSGTVKQGEIVIDRMLQKNQNVQLGDTLKLNQRDFTVTGIVEGGPLFQQSYISMDEARDIFHMNDLSNFFLVFLKDRAAIENVMQRIEEQNAGLDAQTEEEFATNNEKEIMDKFLPIIGVLVFIGFIVGVVIISLTIYTATIEKTREYGVLKAIGARNGYLYRIVLMQSGITGALGFALGVGLTLVGGNFINDIEPLFVTLIQWQDVLWIGGLTIAMIIVASYIPVRKVLRIDPAIVFKA